MPTVSVIVPNYNHERYLRKRIESILAQTYQDFELVLLDDCSTDNSREILRAYEREPRVRIQFNEQNSGSTFKQWNKGVGLARGRYIWMAESDDYADHGFLEKLVARLEAEPKSVLCYCRSLRVSADGELGGFLDSYLSELDAKKWTGDFCSDGREECRKYLIHCNTVLSASSVLFRQEAYWRAGGADESLVLGGDWKMWAAMALTGGRLSYLGEALNYYRFHEASVTERTARNGLWAKETLEVVGWIEEHLELDACAQRILSRDLARVWIPAVLSRKVPRGRRWSILVSATARDLQAPIRLLPAALTALRMTALRRWRSLRGVYRPSVRGSAKQ